MEQFLTLQNFTVALANKPIELFIFLFNYESVLNYSSIFKIYNINFYLLIRMVKFYGIKT